MQKYFILITGVILVLEFYIYQAFKTIFSSKEIRAGYWILTAALYLMFFYILFTFNKNDKNPVKFQILTSVFVIFMIPKLIASVFLMIDDIMRLGEFAFHRIQSENAHYPARRKFLSITGLGLTGALMAFLTDGIIAGKYRFKVRKVKIKFPNLSQSFKGYKIIQISDVHSGSFLHPEKLQYAIDLINEQNADLVLFTGDMVNSRADEFVPFVKLFKSIKAKDGKFSVLGNHDYGTYIEWASEKEAMQNIPNLIKLQNQAGFEVLMNENRSIERNGEKLYIIGVENWGEKPFPQLGDLDRATSGIPTEAPKILMSHDPTHFDRIVKKHPSNIFLTLSGHTHGMQFGLDLKNVKWSPVQYRYPKWADLYQSEGKYLYVNRGFGVLAYPGRAGVKPEITLFELS